MAGTFPQAWEEVALITISKIGVAASGADVTVEANAMTETIDIGEPDYPGESIPNLAGGRVWKQSPQEDGEITLEFYPTDASLGDGENNKGLFQAFAGGDWDTTEPITADTSWGVGVDRTRDRFRVAIMWTDDVNVTSAENATSATDSVALRFAAMSCRMTSHKASFTDGILKVTATFKFPAMNQAGDTKMFRWESTNDGDTTAMTALPAYDADTWT